jgi:hypothetical protein
MAHPDGRCHRDPLCMSALRAGTGTPSGNPRAHGHANGLRCANDSAYPCHRAAAQISPAVDPHLQIGARVRYCALIGRRIVAPVDRMWPAITRENRGGTASTGGRDQPPSAGTPGFPPRAVSRRVAKLPKQRLQLSGLPVNVSDDVASHRVFLVSCIMLLSGYTEVRCTLLLSIDKKVGMSASMKKCSGNPMPFSRIEIAAGALPTPPGESGVSARCGRPDSTCAGRVPRTCDE